MESGIIIKEDRIKGLDNIELYCTAYRPLRSKASILIVHGIGEHSGRYAHVATFFARLGYAVYTFDLRGHGRSGGRRGHIISFDDYAHDIDTAREMIPANGKVYLMGHSLGGLIVAYYSIKDTVGIAGIILTSPALGLSMRIPVAIKAATAVFGAICPALDLTDNVIPSRYLSHDPEVVTRYDTDPLVHRHRSLRFVSEFARAMRVVSENCASVKMPALILQAGDDKIVSKDSVKSFYDRIRSAVKEYKTYPGFYHEILNETGKESVFKDIRGWLDTLA